MRTRRSLLTGPVTTPANSPARQPVAARSIAAHATNEPSPSGTPGVAANVSNPTAIFVGPAGNVFNHPAGPITAMLLASSRCAASQAAIISGPTPAGSPQVNASLVSIGLLRRARTARPRKASFSFAEKTEKALRLRRRKFSGSARVSRQRTNISGRKIHGLKRRFQLGNRRSRKAATFEPNGVESDHVVPFRDHRKMRHIAGDGRVTRDHHALSNPTKLVNRRLAAEKGVIAHRYVAAQKRGVRENNLAADDAIVRDVT